MKDDLDIICIDDKVTNKVNDIPSEGPGSRAYVHVRNHTTAETNHWAIKPC